MRLLQVVNGLCLVTHLVLCITDELLTASPKRTFRLARWVGGVNDSKLYTMKRESTFSVSYSHSNMAHFRV